MRFGRGRGAKPQSLLPGEALKNAGTPGRRDQGRINHPFPRLPAKAGTVWINDSLTDNYAGPFSGMKMSGGARELGQEGLDEFRETKHVHWDFKMENKAYWYPYGKE